MVSRNFGNQPEIDLWPNRLLWLGDSRAFSAFGVRVPEHEPGPWLGNRPWTNWRERSCPLEQLDCWLLNNEPHLRCDAFASINRFYRPRRSLDNIIRLSAAFIDIDCGRSARDCSAEDASKGILEMVSIGLLPQPSMLQFSGRGLWAFWLLRDGQEPGFSPFANAYNRELWRAIQNRAADVIVSQFPILAIDRGALDAARMTRLNGSINSSCGRRVRYELLSGTADEPLRYTLEDLSRFYDLSLPRRPAREPASEERRDLALEEHRRRQDERQAASERRKVARQGVDASLSVWGRLGHITLWQNRLRFLDRVRAEVYSGLIPYGSRYNMLSAYAYCHAKLTKDQATLEAKVFEICRRCCEEVPGDPIRDSLLRSIVKHAREWADAGHQITNPKLAAFAGLDPVAQRELIERLGLNLSPGSKGRSERTQARRELALKIFELALVRSEGPPSARQLARELTEVGCKTGHSTANALLQELWSQVEEAESSQVDHSTAWGADRGREFQKRPNTRPPTLTPFIAQVLDTLGDQETSRSASRSRCRQDIRTWHRPKPQRNPSAKPLRKASTG